MDIVIKLGKFDNSCSIIDNVFWSLCTNITFNERRINLGDFGAGNKITKKCKG